MAKVYASTQTKKHLIKVYIVSYKDIDLDCIVIKYYTRKWYANKVIDNLSKLPNIQDIWLNERLLNE